MNQQLSGSERASRFLAGLPASIQLDGLEHPCRAHDLSRNGVLLVGDLPMPGMQEVRVTVSSGRGDLQLTTRARVVRSEKNPDGPGNRIGLQFLEIEEEDRTTLESLVSRVVEGMTPAALEALPENASRQEVRNALDSVPLAHRITLAKRGLPKHREHLVQDPHLQVIDALARNPNLLLHEIVTLLRMPSLLPHTLATISKDPRWRDHEQVNILIATHRNTPMPVAEEVVSRLRRPALQKVIQAPGLHAAVRAKLLRRLGRPESLPRRG